MVAAGTSGGEAHLPPIEPMTPQLSQMRRIKDSGDELMSTGSPWRRVSSLNSLSSTPEDGDAGKQERKQRGADL